jgi:hypothetical protein
MLPVSLRKRATSRWGVMIPMSSPGSSELVVSSHTNRSADRETVTLSTLVSGGFSSAPASYSTSIRSVLVSYAWMRLSVVVAR